MRKSYGPIKMNRIIREDKNEVIEAQPLFGRGLVVEADRQNELLKCKRNSGHQRLYLSFGGSGIKILDWNYKLQKAHPIDSPTAQDGTSMPYFS